MSLLYPCILQARILEWVSIFFSRGSSQLRDQNLPTLQTDSLLTEPPGKSSTCDSRKETLGQGLTSLGGPVVKTLPSSAGGTSLTPSWVAKIPYTLKPKHQKHKTEAIF